MSLTVKLDVAIKSAVNEKSEPLDNNEKKHLQKENNIVLVNWRKENNICFLMDALKTVPPTLIESERAFSAAGLFITKLRARLSDYFSFLKSHYKYVYIYCLIIIIG